MAFRMRAKLRVAVIGRDGRVKERRTLSSNSFVRNAMIMMRFGLFAYKNVSTYVKDVNGSDVDINCGGYYAMYAGDATAPEGDDSYGIFVGTGTTNPTPDDYAPEAKVMHGSGSGQLHYYACYVDDIVVDGNDISFKIRRNFENLSGESITLYEFGVITYIYDGGLPANVLLLRDVDPSGVTLAPGDVLKVEYEIIVST